MKKLSVIVPLYNSEMWLRKCLLSLLNQDIPESEMEIICVNDGSPDNSAELARRIGKNHPSIIVIDQPNQGPSGARNNGIKHAAGKYLCFVDPDDFVEPNVYGRLVQQMENEQLDLLRFNYQIVDENYQLKEKHPSEKRFNYSSKQMSGAEFLATRLDTACNIWRYMYRAELITLNQLWLFAYGNYDDTPWLPLMLLKVERMNISDTVVYDYLDRADSLVRKKSEMMALIQMNGAIQLLSFFCQCMSNIERSGGIIVEKEWQRGVYEWFRRIQTNITISYLNNMAIFFYDQRKKYMNKLLQLHIIPLSTGHMSFKVKRKVWLINLQPSLYIWFMHSKHK